MAPPAFLLVFTEPGPDVSDEEYNDWYNNEHIPLRVDTPAFLSWTRWKAADGEKPAYGASYDLESYAATKQAPYTTLAETRSDREKDILRRLQLMDRRHYELYEGLAPPPSALYDPATPAPYVVFVSVETPPEHEEELNKWYDEEHIPMLAKVPGWVRSRRFVLADCNQMGQEAQKKEMPGKYLAVAEWASLDAFETEEFKAVLGTPWAAKIMAKVALKERRLMSLLKKWHFDRPESEASHKLDEGGWADV
ncbi:hypothetical protein IEO21_07590 [Rhodonia placenta]|uniref:Uncharacterized protein n=1 Tax=Rhodonia placenta TaxID=104341 RepID=A0A8H7NXV0_9APHY|nr:hypothetical protein IEO21_07590 [Postia placenta]